MPKLPFVLAAAAVLVVAEHGHAQDAPAQTMGPVVYPRRTPPPVYWGFGYMQAGTQAGREYPVVSSVEPNSPGSDAGLAVGDTIVAVDGRDTREPGPMFRDLHPGSRYSVRLRRDGVVRDTVLVAAPPKTPSARP